MPISSAHFLAVFLMSSSWLFMPSRMAASRSIPACFAALAASLAPKALPMASMKLSFSTPTKSSHALNFTISVTLMSGNFFLMILMPSEPYALVMDFTKSFCAMYVTASQFTRFTRSSAETSIAFSSLMVLSSI